MVPMSHSIHAQAETNEIMQKYQSGCSLIFSWSKRCLSVLSSDSILLSRKEYNLGNYSSVISKILNRAFLLICFKASKNIVILSFRVN